MITPTRRVSILRTHFLTDRFYIQGNLRRCRIFRSANRRRQCGWTWCTSNTELIGELINPTRKATCGNRREIISWKSLGDLLTKQANRCLLTAILFVMSCATLSCQSYTEGLQKGVTRADETAAISALHTISVAQRTYSMSSGGSYGTFEQLVKSGNLDSRFSNDQPKMRGYVLSMKLTADPDLSAGSYNANADPEPPQTGRHFYIDSASGVIHVNDSQPAGASDKTLDQ